MKRLTGWRNLSAVVLAACLGVDVLAQPSPDARPRRRSGSGSSAAESGFKQNPRVFAAFRDVVRGPGQSVVRIRTDGKDIALGTIVSADGLIVTKYSELPVDKAPDVKLRDGRSLKGTVVA